MSMRFFVALVALALVASAAAETPNLNPGLWKYDNTVSIKGDLPIPDTTNSSEQCVRAEDIADGGSFFDELDQDCEILNKSIHRDGMNFSMRCMQMGAEVTMQADLRFDGDRASGTITGQMDTPLGAMDMVVTMAGERIGDCSES